MSLRETKQAETRSKITDATVDLLLARGLQGTLVDEIAAAACISRRTFFNYFPTKQDVFAEWFRRQGDYLAACVSARPKDEAPWASLHYAYREMRLEFGRDGDRVLKLRQILAAEPLLLAKKYECLASTMRNLTPVIEQRLKKTVNRVLVAHVYVQAAMGAYNAACAEWEAAPQGADL